MDGKGNLSKVGHGTVIFNSHSLVVLGAGVDQLGSEYSVRRSVIYIIKIEVVKSMC